MRCLLVVAIVFASAPARADDVALGAAIGAGGQGDAGYGALEVRLDGEWHGVQIGLGGRAVWEGGDFRTREWSRPIDAITILRQLEAHAGPVAIAAGSLAPSTLGHVSAGMRSTLDDRARTGVRAVLSTRGLGTRGSSRDRTHDASRIDRDAGDSRDARDAGDSRDTRNSARDAGDSRDAGDDARDARDSRMDLDATAEIDDVLDPALVGGALAWQLVPAWGLRAATAVDPSTARVAIEVGGARRWERDDLRVDVGASVIGERWRSSPVPDVTPDAAGDSAGDSLGPSHVGLGAVGFASAQLDRAGARWTIAADVRAGNGTNGAAFGPLYRAERAVIENAARSSAGGSGEAPSARAILDDARAGVGAGLAAGVSGDRGWLSIGGRYRPGPGALGTLSIGAPMGRRVQAGAWIAASPRVTAGAAEVRAVWATHFYTSLQMARMYLEHDSMTAPDGVLAPAWSATVWFGASTR